MFKKSSAFFIATLLLTALSGCDETINNTTVVESVPTADHTVVLETYDIAVGLAIGNYGEGTTGNNAQTFRVGVTPGAKVDSITLCIMNDVNGSGSLDTVYSGIPGLPGVPNGYAESLAPITINAFVRDGGQTLSSWSQVKTINGAAAIVVDTTKFAGLSEFFIHLDQEVPGAASFTAVRLSPNPNGGCGATGAVVGGMFNKSVVRFLRSEVSTFTPTQAPAGGGKG